MAEPKLDRKLMEQLMFGTGTARRFTQDSPILPDVWLQYMNEAADEGSSEPYPAVKLLLTPFRESGAGEVRRALHDRLLADRSKESWRQFGHDPERLPRVIYNQTTVAATIYFEDLVRVVLPMTEWWERVIVRSEFDLAAFTDAESDTPRGRVAAALLDPEHSNAQEGGGFPPDMLWLIRVVGAIALVRGGKTLPAVFGEKNGVALAQWEDWKPIVDAVANLIFDLTPITETASDESAETTPLIARSEKALIYSVSLNRQATPTVSRSTLAIKADAARRLFNISCQNLAWGIIDSGIDATHPAFRTRHEKDGVKEVPDEKPFELKKGRWTNQTRVVATYDFTQIDRLLDPATDDQPDRIKALLNDPATGDHVRDALKDLNSGLNSGRTIDWKAVAPFIRVPHDGTYSNYTAGMHDHGTHVAGIVAGDWRDKETDKVTGKSASGDLVGVCPDLKLYDLRVLDRNGRGDEFAVMAALQFVRYLNSTNDYVAIHGVNLSLSIPHDIANYACGRTPVCEECERVVSAGTVVVAAAGNQGYRKYTTDEGTLEAYNSISITDPGNADLIITVGATHRYRPHTYGVSYFSSRGPTGDGRIKPDLVAPGEKISAPLPGALVGVKDGTSMAAPHVSGAAALLMARHNELVGRPARIKEVLKSTATDLGRERYFQGAGMLDVLRALQSV
jgi:serine protease AprX